MFLFSAIVIVNSFPMKKKYALILIAFLCAVLSGYGQTKIAEITFETAGGYTTSVTEFSDGSEDYFIRTDGTSNISGGQMVFANKQGTYFFGVHDTDGDGNPTNLTLNFDNVNISGYTGLEFRIHIAEDDDGGAQDWDGTSYMHISGSIDSGTSQNIIWVEAAGGTNTEPRLDTNFNGTGNGTAITDTFSQFTNAITGSGSLLDIEIEFNNLRNGDEDIAIDNIEIWGTSTVTSDLAISGTPLDHGPTCITTAASTVQYTITNNGAVAALNVAVNSDNTEFVVSNLSATTIAAAGTATYDVTFTPTTIGAKSATITVSSTTITDDATSALTGTGITTPTITTQPTAQNEVIPNTATFTVAATNATSYQWQVDTGAGFNNVTGGTGATTDTYTTGVTSAPMNNNQYRCVVTNTCGSVNSNAGLLTLTTLADVVITEIMYNPPGIDDYEWIEICNLNGTAQDISNYTIDVNGTTRFTFPGSVSVPANSCITVLLGHLAASPAPECAFTPTYSNPIGATNFLTNGGATITLETPSDIIIDSVAYDDADSNATDGNGSSFHVIDATQDNSDTDTNWQAVGDGGSPGDNTLISPCTAPELQLVDASNTDQACGYTMSFGSQATGFDTDVTFDIDNDGSADLTVSSFGISGANTGDFSIVSPATPFVISAASTQTVTVRFTPSGLGVRNASLTINNDDTDEFNCNIALQGTGISPTPDIDVERSTFTSIPSGSTAGNGFDTVFQQTPVNNSTAPKTYYIRNEGTGNLTVTAINLVSGTNFGTTGLPSLPFTLAPGDAPVSFQIVFSPINPIGTKTDTVQILNNDPDTSEAIYTFNVQGEAICAASAITLYPSSGPAGTVVTVSGNGFDGATSIEFGGATLPVTLISSNTIEVTIPSASVSNNILLTEGSGCQSNSYFTIINTVFGGCEGASPSSDLILYELYDENPGNGGMITVYNGTNTTRDLSDYKISRTTNYSDLIGFPYVEDWYLPSGNIAPGELFRLKIGSSACSDAFYTAPYDTIFATGFNANDGIQLRRTIDNSVIDEVLTPSFAGYYMLRNAGTLNPANPYNASFWNIDTLTASECRVVGIAPVLTIPPPSVSVLNSPTFNCSTTLQLSVTGAQGVPGGLGLAYQWYYLAPNTNTFITIPSIADFNNDSTSATLDIINPLSYIDYQFYCRVGENNTLTCYSASNAVKLVADGAIWNGTNWSTPPTIDKIAIIAGAYDTSVGTNGETSFEACQLIVNTLNTLNIANNTFVRVQNNVTVNGNIVVKTDGSFVQVDDSAIVNGDVLTIRNKISVEKETAFLASYQEYTYWSSPVFEETIATGLNEAEPNRIFWFNGRNFRDSTQETGNDDATNPGQDDIDDNANDWQYAVGTDEMIPGVGYASTHNSIGFTPLQYIYIFEGPFNNGVVTVPIFRDDAETNDNNWNFIGNPYPSAIDADDFLTANGSIDQTVGATNGAIFFWSHNTPADGSTNGNEVLNYTQSDYAIINGTGQTAGGDGLVPTRHIPSGQGFFVSMTNASSSTSAGGTIRTTDVVFNNSMRVTGNNNQFFRTSNTAEFNKIRLDLTSDNGIFNQILVGYVDGATNDDDGMYYDATRNLASNASSLLYSLIDDASDKKFAIQGKETNSLTVDEVIPLGFYTSIDEATLYKFSIAELQGDFMNNNTVYLKDNLMNITYDLSLNDYTFTSETGEFNDRFEIVFQPEALSVNENELPPNDLTIIELGNGDVTFSVGKNMTIKAVEILDVLGRTIYNLRGQNSTETYNLSKLSQATYIARVTLSNGQTITKKAVKMN